MQITSSDDVWLDDEGHFSLAELATLAGLPESELRLWVEEGLLTPLDVAAQPWRFHADRLTIVRKAFRLRRDFELEPLALGLVVQLLEQIQTLERELRSVRARLPESLLK